MARVPAKSTSKRIQRSHQRRYPSGKITRVNLGVKKRSNRSLKTTPAISPRPSVKGELGQIHKGTGFEEKQKIPIKLRWRDILKTQKGPTEIDIFAKESKELEAVRKTLQPGEILARKVELIYPVHQMSVGGFIHYLDDEGNMHRSFMEYRMSGASMIEYLQEMQNEGKPVILQFDDDDGMEILAGVRPAEPLGPTDMIPQRELVISLEPAPTKKHPDRIKISNGFNLHKLDTDQIRFFNSSKEYEKFSDEQEEKGLDVFGYPFSPQTRVSDFK